MLKILNLKFKKNEKNFLKNFKNQKVKKVKKSKENNFFLVLKHLFFSFWVVSFGFGIT